ncbi:hypothetical protein FHP29_08465 [Nocardioides albidus]|uniref:Nuclear transport factor 2 family protein n=1 Tax=Nocardioides albidus TaxID=1517589 RepID=A0A5C4W3P6_9ACTN|nr:hypothetical protein [Nocardioides albidus]TNM41989.1 hypothetical protein FHP29_08465 [Nocardioides albidus]
MGRFDITRTNLAVERLLETTTNPRHHWLLQAYNRHRYLEMAGRWKEIFAPEMTVEHPVYHFNVFGISTVLDGAEAVQAVYEEWSRTAQCIFYTTDETLAVGDNMIVSTATIYQQTPGQLLVEAGAPVDPAAHYLVANVEHMIWPYDDEGRLIGEDVWEIDESKRQIIPLDPAEVLTVEASSRLLEPLIKPLPARTF